jgi:glycosyltransferase involved in cell wall biosynthesis
MVQHIRRTRADIVLVNTVTIPWWILAGRIARRRTVVHVHEAEEDGSRIVLTALALPNLLAHRVIVNSRSSASALASPVPRLQARITVVHNGMPGPNQTPSPARRRLADDPATVLLVARLSPRKGVDVALEAIASLRRAGRPVSLIVCGSVFPGYEWFETQLRERADAEDLNGAVDLRGYVDSTWPLLAEADIVIVPSLVEPFGNTAVEALLAQRPLVASNVQGLAEIVNDGFNGLLANPGDAEDLARQIARLLDAPDTASTLARVGRIDALARFSAEAYGSAMLRLLG